MPNQDSINLALWLRYWREEVTLAEADDLPKLLPAEIPAPPLPRDVHAFDSFGLWEGDIRLLNPWLVRDVRRPLYFAILREWLDGLWLIAPFARFPEPATVGEWDTGRGKIDPRQDPLAVLCLWNAHTVPAETLQQSWFIDCLDAGELEKAWNVFRHVITGKSLPEELLQHVGPPLFHPADPRNEYLTEEAAGMSPLQKLAEEYMVQLNEAGPRLISAELGGLDKWVESPLGIANLAPAGQAATGGGGTTLRLLVSELGIRITFRQDPRGELVVAKVTELTGGSGLSYKFDGGVVLQRRKIVGKFSRGRAQFRASTLSGQISLRDRKGTPLVAVVERAA